MRTREVVARIRSGPYLNDVILILVLTLAAGSIPVKLPGAGTIATTEILRVAGMHGSGLAGYVLASRAVFSSETFLLAVAPLGWWTVTGHCPSLGLSSVRSLFLRSGATTAGTGA